MDGTGMDPGYKACSLCTHTCYNEHGFEVVKTPADRIPRHPCFLKTAVDVLKTWMPIPKEFVDLHLDKIRGSVDIEGSNGKVWLVGLGGTCSAQVGFRLGWHAFITDNKLQRGDQLLFTLVAKSRFTVHVFNRLGLETAAPPVTKTEPTVSVNGKRKREESEDEGPEQSESEDDADDSEYESPENESEAPSDSPSETGRTGNSSRVKREKLDEEEQSYYSQKSSQRNGLKKGNGTSKSKPNPSHKKKAASETGDKQQTSQEPGWNSTTYESKRRPVTDAEREKAMEAASSFKTKKASVLVLMKPSHVYRGFWLTIPNSYSKNHMPQERISIKLQDSFGFQWPAQWIKSNQHSGVSGGWAAFSRDHCLEEGDVCVFEVINSKDWILMVHIFRVLQVGLVPNTRGGWENNYNIVYGMGHPNSTASEGRVKRRGPKPKHKLSSTSVKKNLAKALYSEVRKEQSTKRALKSSSPEDSEDVDSEDGLLSSRVRSRHKAVQELRAIESDEVDVKPAIASLGLIKKTPYRTSLTATVKVEKDTYPSMDVKPTSEQMKVSLKPLVRDPICDLFQNYEEKPKVRFESVVKPEPIEVSCDTEKEEKGWYVVNRLISRRQAKDKEKKDFLVELQGTVVQEISKGIVQEDSTGNWWVPSSLFSPDFSKCFIN